MSTRYGNTPKDNKKRVNKKESAATIFERRTTYHKE
jgi:hypothetical protein